MAAEGPKQHCTLALHVTADIGHTWNRLSWINLPLTDSGKQQQWYDRDISTGARQKVR